jgi:hypothetical protein
VPTCALSTSHKKTKYLLEDLLRNLKEKEKFTLARSSESIFFYPRSQAIIREEKNRARATSGMASR